MKKTLKHSLAVLVALAMLLVMAIPAFAQTVGETANGPATITVKNAAKGETYKVVKLFDATYNESADAISYSGTIPTELSKYFKEEANGIVIQTNEDGAVSINGPTAAADFKVWAEKQSPTAQAVADGTTLVFQGLPYGYYVVTTTQGAMVGVDSLKKSAEVYDKNNAYPNNISKTADKTDVNIGDTIEYTVTFDTSNFNGSGEAAKRIKSYTIKDTLPDFLTDVTVTHIVIHDNGVDRALDAQQFNNGEITIDWAKNNGTAEEPNYNESLYNNNASITIKYTAVLTDKAKIDVPGNTNKVSLTWTTVDDVEHDTIPEDPNGPEDPNKGKTVEAEETVFTYAIALQKVNDEGYALAGAEFTLPFYVNTTKADDGAYVYAGTAEGENKTNTVTTPENGLIIVKGVQTGTYTITETKAPDGYNKLTAPFTVAAEKVGKASTNVTTYLDANGDVTNETTEVVVTTENNIAATVKVVVNKKGAFLPSTGGIGTYIVVLAGLAIVAAGVILMTRKNKKEEE